MIDEKKLLAEELNKYINLEKTHEECIGFIDGFEKALEQVKNCSIPDVSQQRELLIATIEKVKYNLDGYGALTSSQIAERLEKAINCC